MRRSVDDADASFMLTGFFRARTPAQAIDLSTPESRRPYEDYGHGPLVGDVITALRAQRSSGELTESEYTARVTEALGGYVSPEQEQPVDTAGHDHLADTVY